MKNESKENITKKLNINPKKKIDIEEKNKLNSKTSKKDSKKIKKKIILTTALMVFLFVFSIIFAIINIGNEKILNRISIMGIDVGNMTQEDAKEMLNKVIKSYLLLMSMYLIR